MAGTAVRVRVTCGICMATALMMLYFEAIQPEKYGWKDCVHYKIITSVLPGAEALHLGSLPKLTRLRHV